MEPPVLPSSPPETEQPSAEPVISSLTLGPHVRKAEAWAFHNLEDPMYEITCSECQQPMWTWSDRENICETCSFEMRKFRQEMKNARDSQAARPAHVNPFERQPETQVQIGIEKGKQPQVNPYQTKAVKPHQIGISTIRKWFNPFVR